MHVYLDLGRSCHDSLSFIRSGRVFGLDPGQVEDCPEAAGVVAFLRALVHVFVARVVGLVEAGAPVRRIIWIVCLRINSAAGLGLPVYLCIPGSFTRPGIAHKGVLLPALASFGSPARRHEASLPLTHDTGRRVVC